MEVNIMLPMRIFFLILLLVGSSSSAFAETSPVISGNGFSCSKDEELVTCRGSFPSASTPILESVGYNVVWIRAEYPGYRYTYFSDSGCLCRTELGEDGGVKINECTSRGGQTKNFKKGKDPHEWCLKN